MLISSYFSNNVHVFNACDGQFLRILDDQGRIRGAQATRIGPDGRLYVVSERNHKILRYDTTTLEFIDEFASGANLRNPTGLAFGPDGNLYVATFDEGRIYKLDGNTGAVLAVFANGISGPDAGMTFGPDGNLYVPAYNGNNIMVFDGSSGSLVKTISVNLSNPRVIAFEPESNTFLVSVFGSGKISRYNNSGGFVNFVTENFSEVTGLAHRKDGTLFAISNISAQVRSVDPLSGAIGNFFTEKAGINGPTFITFMDFIGVEPIKTNQFWAVGAGDISGLSISIDAESFVFATGGVFGDAFDPQNVQRHPFGTINITLKSCTEANLIFNTNGNANMGSGSYELTKIGQNGSMTECLETGFDAAMTSQNALSGAWYGGPDRSGEGFFIDVLDNGLAVVAWFTFGVAEADSTE